MSLKGEEEQIVDDVLWSLLDEDGNAEPTGKVKAATENAQPRVFVLKRQRT